MQLPNPCTVTGKGKLVATKSGSSSLHSCPQSLRVVSIVAGVDDIDWATPDCTRNTRKRTGPSMRLESEVPNNLAAIPRARPAAIAWEIANGPECRAPRNEASFMGLFLI